MLTIGLTGGIACGKSVVRERIEALGVPTLDADRVVHELFAPGTSVSRDIAARFGPGVIATDGSVDRKALGALVFDNDENRNALESIVHPSVFAAIESFLEDARAGDAELAVVDAALMYETGSYERYDKVIAVYCPPELQLERLMKRDRLSREQAASRIAAQLPAVEKRDRADYVVDTSATIPETLEQVDDVLEQLRTLA